MRKIPVLNDDEDLLELAGYQQKQIINQPGIPIHFITGLFDTDDVLRRIKFKLS